MRARASELQAAIKPLPVAPSSRGVIPLFEGPFEARAGTETRIRRDALSGPSEDGMAPHGHKFDPAHRAHLLDPERARYLPAKEILSKFPLTAGAAAVDIGCGPGYWTIPMAEIVGPSGRVYAVDLEGEMLADLRTRLEARPGLPVQVMRSSEDRIPLPARSVDFAFLACVLHELDGPGTMREAARVLRPGGALGIVDWNKIRQDIGPPYRHRLSPVQASAALVRGGFSTDEAFDAAPYHYGIVARPKESREARDAG